MSAATLEDRLRAIMLFITYWQIRQTMKCQPYTAMMVSTVAACVKTISESIASLPLVIYERSDAGRQVAYNHALYHLLADSPNDEMSAFTFWEWVTVSLCLHGNGYAQIQRD